MTREERNERMGRILDELKAVVMWVQGEGNDLPSLHDTEGNCIVVLPAHFVEVIDVVDDEAAGSLVEGIADILSIARRSAFDYGASHGRRSVINTVHELLGIDRIVDALERSSAHV
jgi:hypothetical protein